MNSNNFFAIFHPEHFLEVLKAGGIFTRNIVFRLPAIDSGKDRMGEVVLKDFPPMSLEKYEVWIKFKSQQDDDPDFFTLVDIESAHFYSTHRQEATPGHILKAIRSFGIEIKEPIQIEFDEIVREQEDMHRKKLAKSICEAWLGTSVSFSDKFLEQVRTGFEHQQSPFPEKLSPINSEEVWARLISYNPGLRKFDEKPEVLPLQDLQEVLKRTDQDFRDQLKSISEKFGVKLSDVIQNADESVRNGIKLSQWIMDETSKPNSYLYELNRLLGKSLYQQNFIYSAVLYLFWREKILNIEYSGFFKDNVLMKSFLTKNIEMNRQSTAEALFTIVYAGGPRVFRNANIEARLKIRNLDYSVTRNEGTKTAKIAPVEQKLTPGKKFIDSVKELGKDLYKIYQSKKKEAEGEQLKKDIQKILKLTNLQKGVLDHQQYLKLCVLLGTVPEIFDSDTIENELSMERERKEEKSDNINSNSDLKHRLKKKFDESTPKPKKANKISKGIQAEIKFKEETD